MSFNKKIIFFPLIFFTLSISSHSLIFSESKEPRNFSEAKEYFQKGFTYYNNMYYLSAVEFFRKAVTIYPEYYTAREFLARAYKLAGFTEEAKREWENLAEISSNNAPILNKLDALTYTYSGQTGNEFTTGSGELIFARAYDAGNLRRFRLSKPIDLAIDSERNLYVTCYASGKLVKLDPNGEGISLFNLGADSGLFGVDWAKGKICVSDFRNDTVYILTDRLSLIKSFGKSGKSAGEFHGPEGVCFDADYNLYVVDSGNHRIQKFDPDGNFILSFGRQGEYEGELNNPSSVTMYGKKIYVTDTGNKRIASFDGSGNFLENYNIPGLESPRSVSFYDNNMIISDEKKGLLFYTAENSAGNNNEKNMTWFYSWENSQKHFSRLISSKVDRDGVLYCLDHNFESILVFMPVQLLYSNLFIEITSIDLKKYPLVAFNLNVRKRNGTPLYNLQRENFKLVEDDALIRNLNVDYLKNAVPSVSIVLCVDRSDKNAGYHNEIPWISDFILKKMKKNDSIQLLEYNKDYWLGNDFDWSRRRTISALKKRSYSAGKAIDKVLYNALSNVLPKNNRRGVVLVTDGSVGNDSFSTFSQENIIDYAKCHFIPIYIITFRQADQVLERIAKETGGGIYRAGDINSLRKIYDNVKNSEEYRYVIFYSTFKSQPVKGWWSDVRIEINDKGHRGIEWGGYFVP